MAFEREKQIQGWSRKKKKALINGQFDELRKLAECQNESHYLLRSDENGTSIAALGFARATVEEEKQKN